MKKKVPLLILSVALIVLILSTTTYALFYSKDKLDNAESYTTGNLQIVLQNDEEGLGNKLTLNNALPMSDTDGKNSTPYRFKVSNVGNLDYTFDLTLTKSGTINGKYVKVMVDDNEIASLESNTITIASDLSLSAGESKIVEVRIWLTENTPNTEIGKTLSATLNGTGKGQVFMKASDKIIKLAGSCTSYESGFEGICATNSYTVNGETKYHEYRYIGGEVNNYVKFNNDMYRIIGVFDSNSHGKKDKWLVKLISANELTSQMWGQHYQAPSYEPDNNFSNDWTGNTTGTPASANIILNQFYLNGTDTSDTYKKCINWTIQSADNKIISENCSNIVGYGIQTENIRNYIEDDVTWYLKGMNNNNYTKSQFYECERSENETVTNCNAGGTNANGYYDKKVIDTSETPAKIGLIYVSDYLYASGYVASSDTITTAANEDYMNSNWLYSGFIWTITPVADKTNTVQRICGNLCPTNTNVGSGIFPVFYLKSTIRINSGKGTFQKPYILG